MTPEKTSISDDAGYVLYAWAVWQCRMREIARREFGIYDGEVKGQLVYHAPEAIR